MFRRQDEIDRHLAREQIGRPEAAGFRAVRNCHRVEEPHEPVRGGER